MMIFWFENNQNVFLIQLTYFKAKSKKEKVKEVRKEESNKVMNFATGMVAKLLIVGYVTRGLRMLTG